MTTAGEALGLPADALEHASLAFVTALRAIATKEGNGLMSSFVYRARSGEREVVRVDDEAEVAAMTMEATAAGRSWASAAERVWRYVEQEETVLVVEFWGAGMQRPATVLQPFRRNDETRACERLGPMLLRVNGDVVEANAARETLAAIDAGVRDAS
ncbi:MAG: hypothetical protein M3081_19745 [Gemmatimonadota bacterium]|nr:hypothetical protein [Gemmatimonadota bacterium]